MKYTFYLLFLTLLFSCSLTKITDKKMKTSFEEDKIAIEKVMKAQENAWNSGDIDAFMLGYVNSDSLVFIGSRGLTYGWQPTLENYKKGYPDKSAMGKLHFDILELKQLSTEYFYMIGRYELTREKDKPSGYFSLLWQKVKGEWKIIADQTCG